MDICTSIRAKKCRGVTSLFLMTAFLLLLSMVSVDILYLRHIQSASALIPNSSIAIGPIANNLKIQTTSNINKTITLTGTDPILSDIPKFSVINLPFNGNLSDGKSFNTVVYTPNHSFVGHDRFTYRVTDDRGKVSNTATVFITVIAPPPPPPTAKDLKVQATSNSNVTIMLSGTDQIKDDRLKFSVVDLPINGILFKGKTPNSIIYKSDGGFIGNDIFTYRSTDRLGVNSTIATVFITVNAQTSTSTLSLPPTQQQPTVNMVTNVSSGTVDQFGIKEIYPTKPGGEQWFMNMNDPNHDNRTDPKAILTISSMVNIYAILLLP
jgi:Big-like domain-containing protein